MSQAADNHMEQYINAKTEFSDFTRFRDASDRRDTAQKDFIGNNEYVPLYDYPDLFRLYDQPEKSTALPFAEKKRLAQEAVMELEARKYDGQISPEEYELYADAHELRLKRMILVEAARRLNYSGSSSESEVARQEYRFLNHELYGEVNKPTFDAMMMTESERVERFEPKNEQEYMIKSQLLDYFRQNHFEGTEKPLMEVDELAVLREAIERRYGAELAEIPDTDDDVYYDAIQCAGIFNQCLAAGALAGKGWRTVVDDKAANPTTNVVRKEIRLPLSTRRNASELRRLYIHEVGVHAVRGQNGEDTGKKILKTGTGDYADIEEGEGVVFECALADTMDNPSYHRARDRYIVAGLSEGVDGVPKDGRRVYEIMWRLIAIRNAEDGELSEDAIASAKKVHIRTKITLLGDQILLCLV